MAGFLSKGKDIIRKKSQTITLFIGKYNKLWRLWRVKGKYIMKRLVLGLAILLAVTGWAVSPAAAAQFNVVDGGGEEEAWPSDVVGSYVENGTNNGRPCYQGPNGFWLYHGLWSEIDTWFIGNIKGQTEINSSGVRFFYTSTSPTQTPPLDTNFGPTNSALGVVRVTTGGGSPPPIPDLYTISGATGTSFTCHWADISTATGYKLDVSTSASFADFVSGYNGKDINIPAGTPLSQRPISQSVTGLTPGSPYYCRIRSYNGFGESGNSPALSVATIPGIPSLQAASKVNEDGFTANWISQAGADSYRLFVSAHADFSSPVVDNRYVSETYAKVTGLEANTTYYYRIKAANSSGESGLSSPMTVTTAPDIPVISAAQAVETHAFTAGWQASPAAAGYYLDIATDSSFDFMVAGYDNRDVGPATSYLIDQGITPYTDYYMRVRAYNSNGISSSSTTASVKTLPVAAVILTDSVSDIAIYSATAHGEITSPGAPAAEEHGFCWNSSGNPTISDAVTTYGEVEAAGEFSGTLSGLSPVTQYYVRAYATNPAGTVYGDAISFTTLQPNNAPVLDSFFITLAGTDEDTTSTPIAVSQFLQAHDEDLPPDSLGIAVDGATGNGSWQYSVDGVSWTGFGAVSEAASLLLGDTAQIRYLPDGFNGETASFSFRAWDGSAGSQGEKVSTADNGGYSAFSSQQCTAQIVISDVNDAPQLLSIEEDLGSIDENSVMIPVTIGSILQVNDADLGAMSGAAISGASGNGIWQYSADGSSWSAFGSVSPTAALLLPAYAQIRYVPDGMNGETASFSFRAWDISSGTAFGSGDTSTNGGVTAFSASQCTATLIVNSVNNAPVLTSSPFEFTATDIITPGQSYPVSAFAEMSDVDLGALQGIAVWSASGGGTWQYSSDGLAWNDFGAVSASQSLLLDAAYKVRYLPAVAGAETAVISFRAWDQSSGLPGGKADTTVNGGSTAFSANTQSASIEVFVPVYTISGRIDIDAAAAVLVTLTGLPGNPHPDSLGIYSAEVEYGWEGTVTPELEGYTFVPASLSYSDVAVDCPGQDYTAVINTYDITVSPDPLEGGTAACLTGNGEDIEHGAQVTVVAQANPGYAFVNWTESGLGVSTDSSYTFVATADRDLVANFSFDPVQIVEIGSDDIKPIVLPPGILPEEVEYRISVTNAAANPRIQLPLSAGIATSPRIIVTTPGQVELEIPAGTEISGPSGWDGTIGLPVISNSASLNVGSNQYVIELGITDGTLEFSSPVRLFVPGQGGKNLKVIRQGKADDIKATLNANTREAAAGLLQGELVDAKFIEGSDLYIWTTRFCEFVTYSNRSQNNDPDLFDINGGELKRYGVTVKIPADAILLETRVSIEPVTDISGLTPEESRLVSDVFLIKKDNDREFRKVVTITLPFVRDEVDRKSDRVSLFWYDDDAGKWRELDHVKINWEQQTVSGEIDRFGMFAVIARGEEKQIPPPKPDDEEILSDIRGHWAYDNIKALVASGAIAGYPDKTFKPDRTISRAEVTVVLVKAFGLSASTGKVFSDTSNHWARDYISVASTNGIIEGYSDQHFGPDDPVTREQLAVMICRAAKITSDNFTPGFSDQSSISAWALPYVAAASQYQVIGGYPDGSFRPQGQASRAEAVTIIANALKL